MSPKLSQLTKPLFILAIFAVIISALIGYDAGVQALCCVAQGSDLRSDEIGTAYALFYGFTTAVISFTGIVLYRLVIYFLYYR